MGYKFLQLGGHYDFLLSHFLSFKFCSSVIACKAGFTSEYKQNTNAAFENNANVRYRRVTEVRQTEFGYPSTVGTSKGIRIQYVYVESIRCIGKFRTVYECTIHSASALTRIRIPFACRCKPGLIMNNKDI